MYTIPEMTTPWSEMICNPQHFHNPGTLCPYHAHKIYLSLQQATLGSCRKDFTLHLTFRDSHHEVDLTGKAAGLGTEFSVFGTRELSVLFSTLQQKVDQFPLPTFLYMTCMLQSSSPGILQSIWFQAQMILPHSTMAANTIDNVFIERQFFQTQHCK